MVKREAAEDSDCDSGIVKEEEEEQQDSPEDPPSSVVKEEESLDRTDTEQSVPFSLQMEMKEDVVKAQDSECDDAFDSHITEFKSKIDVGYKFEIYEEEEDEDSTEGVKKEVDEAEEEAATSDVDAQHALQDISRKQQLFEDMDSESDSEEEESLQDATQEEPMQIDEQDVGTDDSFVDVDGLPENPNPNPPAASPAPVNLSETQEFREDHTCPICQDNFPDDAALRRHLKDWHISEEVDPRHSYWMAVSLMRFSFQDPQCPICEMRFTRVPKAYSHIIAVHTGTASNVKGRPTQTVSTRAQTAKKTRVFPSLFTKCPICKANVLDSEVYTHLKEKHFPSPVS